MKIPLFSKSLIAFGFCAIVIAMTSCENERSSGPSDDEIVLTISSSSSESVESSSSIDEGLSSSDVAASSSSGEALASSSSTKAERSSSSVKKEDSSSSLIDEKSSSSIQSSSSMNSIYNAENNTLTDLRDNQVYKTVTIGEQIWMAENLNYETTSGSYCYNNKLDSCAKYGRLYAWATSVDQSESVCGMGHECGLSGTVQGVCPEGWHIPDLEEWQTLVETVGENVAGSKLKTEDNYGEDAFGFSALLAGTKNKYGNFSSIGQYAFFWSSTEVEVNYAHYVSLNIYKSDATIGADFRNFAFSIRCLKD